MNATRLFAAILALIMTGQIFAGSPGDTVLSYQGELQDGGELANGSFNMDFSLWDVLSGGNQIGETIMIDGVQVVEGRFTVELDFGTDAFDNNARWLEIEVQGVMLSPRQPISRAPYAIQTRGIFVDGVDNVGIGTVTPDPTAKLHLIGPIMSDGVEGGSFVARNPNNPTAGVSLNWFNDVARICISGEGPRASGGFDIQRTGNNSLMRILHNGNIGIGTTLPNSKMQVTGDGSGTVMRLTNGGGGSQSNTGLIIGDVTGSGRAATFFGITTSTLMTVTNTGNAIAAEFVSNTFEHPTVHAINNTGTALSGFSGNGIAVRGHSDTGLGSDFYATGPGF